MTSLGRFVRRLRPTFPHRPSRPLLPGPRGEYANDGFPRVHPRSLRDPGESPARGGADDRP